MTNPLHASQENVSRAKRKFADMKLAINRFLQSSPYSVRFQFENNLNHMIACREKEPDIDVAFDVVDLVLRLRAALDKATVALVSANGRGTSGVGFPFGGIDRNTGKPNEFPDARMTGKYGLEKKLTPDQWRFICAQRPHPGGNETLWAINEIANADKHREGLVKITASLGYGIGIRSGMFDEFIPLPTQFQHILRDQEREEILASMGPLTSQADVEHRLTVSVVFGEGYGVDGRNVLTTLNEQIRIVEYILKGIRAFL